MNMNLDKKFCITFKTSIQHQAGNVLVISIKEYNHLCVKVHLSGRDDKETLREVRYYKRLYKRNLTVKTISHLWHPAN